MNNLFSAYHPLVGFMYLAIAIVFCMAAFHPVYVGISFAGALVASFVFKGMKPTLRSLAWTVPLCLVIAVCNMVFTSAGSTELFNLFGRAFYLEALCYGCAMGAMFAAMMLWFMVYAAVMDSESTTTLMGNALPLVSLMISQVMRLVPQFIRRGRAIGAVQGATSAAAARTKKETLGQSLRTLSVLMGWGMEDGIVRSDAMRARGYGCGIKRTRYRRQRFALRDGVAVAAMVALTALNAFLASVACSQFGFYPYMDTLVVWWGYAPYCLFVAIPLILAVKERLSWL